MNGKFLSKLYLASAWIYPIQEGFHFLFIASLRPKQENQITSLLDTIWLPKILEVVYIGEMDYITGKSAMECNSGLNPVIIIFCHFLSAFNIYNFVFQINKLQSVCTSIQFLICCKVDIAKSFFSFL